MKKSLLFLFFIFLHVVSYSQFFFVLKEIGETAPGQNPVVQISAINVPAGAKYQQMNFTQTTGNYGYTSTGAPSGIYSSNDIIYNFSSDIVYCDIESAWFNAFAQFDPGFEFQVLSWQEVSEPGAEDGTITLVTSNPLAIQLSRFNGYTVGEAYSSSLLNDTTVIFTGLKNESIILTNLTSGKRRSGRFGPLNYSAANGFTIDVPTTDAIGGCNGSATVVSFGAVGNISCSWSFVPDIAGSSQNELCPGLYQVTATDELGQEAWKEFTVAEQEYVYDEDIPIGFEEDTVIDILISNCELDYGLDLDSSDMQVNMISDNGISQLVSVDLFIYQNGNTYFFSDTFDIILGTNVLFNATVYCEELKSTFNGRTFRYGYRTSSVKVENNVSPVLSVSPNPSASRVKIEGIEFPEGILTDIRGKVVMKIITAEFSLENLECGTYLLTLENNHGIIRIVKQ